MQALSIPHNELAGFARSILGLHAVVSNGVCREQGDCGMAPAVRVVGRLLVECQPLILQDRMLGGGSLKGASGDRVVRHARAGLLAAGSARGRWVETDALHHPTPLGVVEPVVAGLAEVGLLHVHHLVDEDRGQEHCRGSTVDAWIKSDLVDATALGLVEALVSVEPT